MHWRNRNFRYTVLLLGLPLLAAGLLWLVTDWYWLLLWLAVINFTTLLAFRYDKAVAADRKKRIPEKNLLRPIYLGGTLGALLGMYVFRRRHKTGKPGFFLRVWLALAIHLLVMVVYYTFYL
jgi:uncharacterized membrane protein YsdA (DUF1294 family)